MEFVGAIGDEGIKFIPIVYGIIFVLLLFLRQVTNRLWWSKKEMLKGTGQNPEANVNVEVEYPYIEWLSKPFLAAAVANSDGAGRIANSETDIQRQADSMFSYNFMVDTQSRSQPHLVRLS